MIAMRFYNKKWIFLVGKFGNFESESKLVTGSEFNKQLIRKTQIKAVSVEIHAANWPFEHYNHQRTSLNCVNIYLFWV